MLLVYCVFLVITGSTCLCFLERASTLDFASYNESEYCANVRQILLELDTVAMMDLKFSGVKYTADIDDGLSRDNA